MPQVDAERARRRPATGRPAAPLATGFTPDPLTLLGITTRALRVDSTRRAPVPCARRMTGAPQHQLALSTPFAYLKFVVVSARRLGVVVEQAGRVRCANEGAFPFVAGAFASGPVKIWVLSQRPSSIGAPYELRVTELASEGTVRPGRASIPSASGAELGLLVEASAGENRDRRLRRGFLPDPRRDEGTTAGELDVRRLGPRCRGFVTAAPSHVLTVGRPRDPKTAPCRGFRSREDHEFDYLRVAIRESPGASLVVLTPDGRVLCDAPDRGDASVEAEHWPVGCYRIWVGTPEPGLRLRYRISYTESRAAAAP